MFVGLVFAIVLLTMLFDKIKNKTMETQSLTNIEYITDAIDEKRSMLALYVVGGLIFVGLIMLFVNCYLFTIFLAFALAIIIAMYSSQYIGMSFWALVYNKEKDQRLRNRIEREKKLAEKKANKKKNDEKEDNEKVVV
jgi:preprotein translocase subunit SecF